MGPCRHVLSRRRLVICRDATTLITDTRFARGFLPRTTKLWEAASERCLVRRVIIRTGIVLTTNGGALPPLARPVKAMIAPVIGGDQYMSWIHIDDLCGIYMDALENEIWQGVYNAVVPDPVLHRDFVGTLKKVLNPAAITINVPPAFIRFLLGELSHVILDSARVLPDHLVQQHFSYSYPYLEAALKNLYGR